MDNKKTGKFIAERRKALGLTQKQLAEKMSVTDKAVSKWETGRGSPDISLLTVIADTLEITVVELLEGRFIEKEEAKKQTESVIIKALQKAKKEQLRTVAAIFIILAVLFSLVNIVSYAYWGRHHKVLYDVDTVFVLQDEENSDKYDFYYNCTVRNWWFDPNDYSYTLVNGLSGEPGSWYFKTKTNIFTDSPTERNFVIHAEFDASTVTGSVPSVKEVVRMGVFHAYDKNGEIDEGLCLYMNDFADAEIIIL